MEWEYKTLVIPFSEVDREPDDLTTEYLTPLGSEGWELISCFRQMGGVGWVYTYKREKDSTLKKG